jgi:hypothetical protein
MHLTPRFTNTKCREVNKVICSSKPKQLGWETAGMK